jgi:hypothetical protein
MESKSGVHADSTATSSNSGSIADVLASLVEAEKIIVSLFEVAASSTHLMKAAVTAKAADADKKKGVGDEAKSDSTSTAAATASAVEKELVMNGEAFQAKVDEVYEMLSKHKARVLPYNAALKEGEQERRSGMNSSSSSKGTEEKEKVEKKEESSSNSSFAIYQKRLEKRLKVEESKLLGELPQDGELRRVAANEVDANSAGPSTKKRKSDE